LLPIGEGLENVYGFSVEIGFDKLKETMLKTFSINQEMLDTSRTVHLPVLGILNSVAAQNVLNIIIHNTLNLYFPISVKFNKNIFISFIDNLRYAKSFNIQALRTQITAA
jgi:hypothetical protein